MSDIKIIVRSHKRESKILEMTLGLLARQEDLDLSKCLYLNINRDELPAYEAALGDFPRAGYIVCEKKGGHHSINTTIDYFPQGEKVVFMDDDTLKMWEWYEGPANSKTTRPMVKLGAYLQDAFATLEAGYAKAFHMYCMPNAFYKKGKPFKEVRPHLLGGDFWGGFNDASMMKTSHAHEDDRMRSARYAERDGGILVYNWLGQDGGVQMEGGMQAGDRGSREARIEKTRSICARLYEEEPLYKKFHIEPYLKEKMDYYTTRMKNIRQIQAIRPFTHWRWSEYFQENPDQQEKTPVEEMFGAK